VTPVDPDSTKAGFDLGTRAGDLLELAGRAIIMLTAFWGFMQGIAKPYMAWKQRKRSEQNANIIALVNGVLEPRLSQFDALLKREENCAESSERILKRQSTIFDDMNLFLEISADNRERHDETAELLDQVFGLDRRVDTDRRRKIDQMLLELRTRTQARREAGD
jgi:hypothetical protein